MAERDDALEYHSSGRHGNIEIVPTNPTATQRDLALAYTPGVAKPCLEISREPAEVYKYTAKSNLVAVISNGTAVLGLGAIGPAAGKPVMEGKAVLFKRFADIDVFDLEIDTRDTEEFIRTVKVLEPTFGGITLEDIAAPECFEIEERLCAEMKIPVFHDDQHGTAIISAAALMNALEVAGKKIGKVKMVISGAGAAAMACLRLYIKLGLRKENVILSDSHGVIFKGRTVDMTPYKEEFAAETKARTLPEAMKGADVFIGLSAGGIVTPEMVRSMAKDPIVFAMANPDPEITYFEGVRRRREKLLGRSRGVMHARYDRAKSDPKRIVFPEGDQEKIIRAAKILIEEGLAYPILLVKEEIAAPLLQKFGVDRSKISIVDITNSENLEQYARRLHDLRRRR